MKRDQGFIMKIVLIIVAIVALKYFFHIDVLAWLKTPAAHKIIDPLWDATKAFYSWLDALVKGWVS